MKSFKPLRAHSKPPLLAFLLFFVAAFPVFGKTDVDFDPNLDYSKYKTFAFLGGVEHLVMLPANPVLMDNRVHRAVTRELTKKGLRELQLNQNPDLVVRYWASTSQQVNVAVMGNWGPYAPYVNSYWAFMYDPISAGSAKESSLIRSHRCRGKKPGLAYVFDAHTQQRRQRLEQS